MFCGVLWCFAGVLWSFAGVLQCFASVLQYFHKTHKTPEKHRKTLKTHRKLTIRRCIAGVFKEPKNRLYCTKHLSQNICKTPQNTATRKTPQNCHKTRFVKLCRKTPRKKRKTLKKSQNRRNTAAIRVARIRCIFQKYFRPVAKVHIAQYAYKLRITGGVTYPRRGSRFFKTQCFAVFCGDFAVFCGVLCACF